MSVTVSRIFVIPNGNLCSVQQELNTLSLISRDEEPVGGPGTNLAALKDEANSAFLSHLWGRIASCTNTKLV